MKPFIVLLLIVTVSAIQDVKITGHWKDGFNGQFCIDVNKELHGWCIHLVFNAAVDTLDIGESEVLETLNNRTEFILKNKNYNADERPGSQLCINFLAHTTGDINPTGKVYEEHLDNKGNDTCGKFMPTTPKTTPGPTLPPGVTTPVPPTFAPGQSGSIPATGPYHVFNDWPEQTRVEGEFQFPAGAGINGWEVNITFAESVTSMELAFADVLKHSADGKVWTVVNKMDKGLYDAGSTVKMRFFAKYTGTKAPDGMAYLMNLGVDSQVLPALLNTGCTKYNYDDVIRKSILFYEAQRSGKLPENNRIPWRGDSGLKDGSDVSVDLTGGWYDAGDHVKFGFPMAYSTAILGYGLLQWRDAYAESGQLDWMYDSIKWPLDYFLKAHTKPEELYVQVGNAGADHGFWGRPEDMKMSRPAYKVDASRPGSDVAHETSAAFAVGYMLYKDKDPAYAAKLKEHATQLYDFGMKNKGRYTDSVSAASGFYSSSNMTDELCWSSLWMYQITNDTKYLTEAEKWFQPGPAWGMSWDDTQAPNQVLLYKFTKKDIYKQAVEETFTYWMPGGTIKYTPKGLAWRLQWGSLRYASNMAFVALMAAEAGINPEKYRAWAMSQIHYALGDTGFSYVIGFGDKYPLRPHHRSASCPWAPAPCSPNTVHRPQPSVHTLYGALVGGPDAGDQYKDTRENYINNEVATDYNAAFQGAVAGLRSLILKKIHPEQLAGTAKCNR